jgi:hypothetical protein
MEVPLIQSFSKKTQKSQISLLTEKESISKAVVTVEYRTLRGLGLLREDWVVKLLYLKNY